MPFSLRRGFAWFATCSHSRSSSVLSPYSHSHRCCSWPVPLLLFLLLSFLSSFRVQYHSIVWSHCSSLRLSLALPRSPCPLPCHGAKFNIPRSAVPRIFCPPPHVPVPCSPCEPCVLALTPSLLPPPLCIRSLIQPVTVEEVPLSPRTSGHHCRSRPTWYVILYNLSPPLPSPSPSPLRESSII